MAEHRQVKLDAGGFSGSVDEELAPLLREAWLAGIETMSGCQDAGESLAGLPETYPHMAGYVEARRGRAYIDFLRVEGVEEFLSLIALGEPDDGMYERMADWLAPGHWETTAIMVPHPEDENCFLAFGYQLGFPRGDMDAMTECLRRGREAGA